MSAPMRGDGRKIVTTAGTRLALATQAIATECQWVTVEGLYANTDKVAVGTVTVVAAAGTARGFLLAPGQSVTIPTTDLTLVYVDSRVDGEGVCYVWG